MMALVNRSIEDHFMEPMSPRAERLKKDPGIPERELRVGTHRRHMLVRGFFSTGTSKYRTRRIPPNS